MWTWPLVMWSVEIWTSWSACEVVCGRASARATRYSNQAIVSLRHKAATVQNWRKGSKFWNVIVILSRIEGFMNTPKIICPDIHHSHGFCVTYKSAGTRVLTVTLGPKLWGRPLLAVKTVLNWGVAGSKQSELAFECSSYKPLCTCTTISANS